MHNARVTVQTPFNESVLIYTPGFPEKTAINVASSRLRHAAGNFYINDKPTGAVVWQQPFGGSRAHGTNDTAGSGQYLLQWVSTRTTKEKFTPARRLSLSAYAGPDRGRATHRKGS